jgi:hypothetical protein
MVGTMNSIKIGEEMFKHKFIMGTADSKAKWHNVAKDTLYDYYPKLDGDMINTNRHIDAAENQLGTTMIQVASDPITDSTGETTQYTHPEGKDKKFKMNYAVPNFGVDHEVLSDADNVAATEKLLGHVFNPKETPDSHKMNYKVPNFGPDRDIAGTQSSIASAESTLGHSWDIKLPESLVQLRSDPINDSTGDFSEYPLPKSPLGYKIDYFVPNFGVDPEVSNVAASLSETEKLMGQKFNLPDEDSQKPSYKTGYFVPNFGEDHDIANIKEATSAAEEKVDHKWNPKQDDEGAWIVPQPIDAASYSYRP